ncbi:MAG: hypothetical protein ABSD20_04480 [Terriglobales bacterium]|jgi:hypothetical protein
MRKKCVDRVVGSILAGWRYDISGIAPEMRADYEGHFAECEHCRGKRRLHRTIDISLIVLASLSAGAFLLAFAALHYFEPRHAFILEVAAVGGFLLSLLVWLIVAVVTPAPLVMADAALPYARLVHDRLPAQIRERIPEELREKLAKT